MQSNQDTGDQNKGSAKTQHQMEPAAYENPLTSGQQQDALRQAEENGRMHQPF